LTCGHRTSATRLLIRPRDPCFMRSLPIQFSETDSNRRTNIDFTRRSILNKILVQQRTVRNELDKQLLAHPQVLGTSASWKLREKQGAAYLDFRLARFARSVGLAKLACHRFAVKNFFRFVFRFRKMTSGSSFWGGGLYSESRACQVRTFLFSIRCEVRFQGRHRQGTRF
jgi:hypothetical protein